MATSFGASLSCVVKCSKVMDAIERVPDSSLLPWVIYIKTGWFADWNFDMEASLVGLLVMFVSGIKLFFGGWPLTVIAGCISVIFLVNGQIHGGRMYKGIEACSGGTTGAGAGDAPSIELAPQF